MRICWIGSLRSSGSSSSSTFFPRLNAQRPCFSPFLASPHAAKTLSFHASVVVMSAGVWGRVTKTRLRPLFKS